MKSSSFLIFRRTYLHGENKQRATSFTCLAVECLHAHAVTIRRQIVLVCRCTRTTNDTDVHRTNYRSYLIQPLRDKILRVFTLTRTVLDAFIELLKQVL